MLKLIAGITLMLISFYTGFLIERYYKSRAQLLGDIKGFFSYASREIGYLKTDIFEVISKFGAGNKLKTIFSSIKTSAEKGTTPEIKEPLLKAQEIKEVTSFFDNLYTADGERQEKLFEKTLLVFDEKEKIAVKEKKQKGEMFKKLLILLGFAILILTL